MYAKALAAKRKGAPLFVPKDGFGFPPPYVSISEAAARRLVEIVLNAKRSKKGKGELTSFDLDEGQLLGMVQGAVSRLANRKMFSMPSAKFRAILLPTPDTGRRRGRRKNSLRSAIEQLMGLLPTHEGTPPWPQMRDLFCGGNPFSDGPDRKGEKSRQDLWADRMHPAAIKKTLTEYVLLMDKLRKLSAGTRPPEMPERMFVEELAEYWTKHLKLPINNGRGPGKRQRGRFADFVREARKLYYQDSDPATKIGSLDGHIRAVADAHNLGANRPR